MAHRHKMQRGGRFARGGSAAGTAKKGEETYAGKGSKVEKEAESKHEGFKRGGRHHLGHVEGHKARKRADKRARGGGIGANKSPFSSAAHGHVDTKRTPATKDHAMPRKDGGGVGFKHGGRPSERTGHKTPFGRHAGAGHEEAHEEHEPVTHYKKGGRAKMHFQGGKGAKPKKDGGKCEEGEGEEE